MKRILIAGAAAILGVVLMFSLVGRFILQAVPLYPDILGDDNYIEKITGLYLVEQSADRDNNIIIYGSSELRTLNISTHPVNFFEGQRNGIQVNLVGRGSCQSLIHAINIAATGDTLTGKKVVLITSPQSYVEDGIAPDMFVANFSEQQYLTLMLDDTVPEDIKQYISGRVGELTSKYNELTGRSLYENDATGMMATISTNNSFTASAADMVMQPFYRLSKWLYDMRDLVASKKLIESVQASGGAPKVMHNNDDINNNNNDNIDWEHELSLAVSEAKKLTDNNDFGMLNDYYTTYIGRRLEQQKDKDSDLSYGNSKEYGDLQILLDICDLKGIEPLFVHVPLHGEWSDYTGFDKQSRVEYYQNVRDIVDRYDNVTMVDLTGYEYEEFFLCDIMHLGWKGWLEVDKAIDRYYREY